VIRIAHASDLHCSERHRLDDWKALHGVFVEQMEEAKVNLILLAGDLFHARSTPAERNAMAEFLIAASRVAPVVIAKGNHDAAGDLDIFGRLGGDARVTVMDRPGVERIWPVYGRAGAAGSSTRVIALPWFDKAHLVAGLDATQDAQTTANATVDAARSLLTTLRAHASEARAAGDIPILVGHVMLGGSVGARAYPQGAVVVRRSCRLQRLDLAAELRGGGTEGMEARHLRRRGEVRWR
jgi:DNA repair exonuclease SbcCD nuclease subunit